MTLTFFTYEVFLGFLVEKPSKMLGYLRCRETKDIEINVSRLYLVVCRIN